MVLETADDQLVTVEVNNNAAYGYDVRAELIGESGSMTMSPPVHTRLDRDFTSSASRYHPDWRAVRGRLSPAEHRFHQIRRWRHFSGASGQLLGRLLRVAHRRSRVEALASGDGVMIDMIDQPDFYG